MIQLETDGTQRHTRLYTLNLNSSHEDIEPIQQLQLSEKGSLRSHLMSLEHLQYKLSLSIVGTFI